MIIYRLTDRIPVRIGEVTFWLAPLSASQKSELLSLITVKQGEERVKPMELSVRAIQFALKKIEGVQDASGETYELLVGEDGYVTRECVEEVLGLDGSDLLIRTCKHFALEDITDPKVEGVVVDFANVQTLKKSAKVSNPVS